jgi:hypothetical protein
MLLYWWKNVHGKVIPMYIKEMKDDEKQVKKDEFGNFINVFIRMAELQGKIGNIEIEANENLPITWNQQKDAIMELLQINNEGITSSLSSPENMPFLKRAIGINDYVIPGEDDRIKQYEEIQQLINSEPIEVPTDPMQIQQAMMMGAPPPPPVQRIPSVQAEFDIDDHPLEADVCRRWLVSDAGRLCKLENPAGYENVLLHMKMHKDMFVQMTQGMPPPQAGPGGPANPQQPSQQNAGVQMNEGQNAPTIQ